MELHTAVVNVHDFPADALGRAGPYGTYNLTRSMGRVVVGAAADNTQFAVDYTTRRYATELPWWLLWGWECVGPAEVVMGHYIYESGLGLLHMALT